MLIKYTGKYVNIYFIMKITFLISSAHYILLFIAWCAYGGRGGLLFHCARRHVNILRLFQSLLLIILLPPPPLSIRQPYRSRLYKGCYVNCFYYDISYLYYTVCQFAALPPLVTSQAYIEVETSVNANLV